MQLLNFKWPKNLEMFYTRAYFFPLTPRLAASVAFRCIIINVAHYYFALQVNFRMAAETLEGLNFELGDPSVLYK